MLLDDTLFGQGDLLKCCVYTLLDLADSDPTRDYGDGAVVLCKYSGHNSAHRMILLNGQWRWTNPRAAYEEERDKLRKKGGLFSRVLGRSR